MQEAAAHDRLIGLTIGNYQVKSKIGEGGMGSVYLAEHPLIGKKVALKVLHAEFSSNRDVRDRFFNEAKAVIDIHHPNIVDIVDYGLIPEKNQETMYFTMEYLDGQSLAHVIRNEAPLPPERSLTIAIQIADALGASHQHGIFHRDLKPDNVMLIQRGRQSDFVKVLDFGIAKLTGGDSGSQRTRTGVIMGTPQYMSPEQCEGKGNIDHRTDIYSLGVLMYQMLTGEVPFKGVGYGEVLVQHLTQPPRRPSTIRPMIPPHVEAVVLKMLEKHPDARFPTMEELMKALADPVGYVEAYGGISNFLNASITATPRGVPLTPMPGHLSASVPIAPLTPTPGRGITGVPTPGMGIAGVPTPTPIPGLVMPNQTTGAHSAGTQTSQGKRIGIIAAVALAGLALGISGYWVAASSDEHKVATIDTRDLDAGAGPGVKAAAGTAEVPTPVEPDTAETEPDKSGDTAPALGNPTDGPEQIKEPAQPDQREVTPPGSDKPAVPTVSVKIESRPEGAEVYVGTESKPRGKTPLVLSLEKSGDPVQVTLKADGYREAVETITPDRDKKTLDLVLKKRERRGSDTKTTTKPDKQQSDSTTTKQSDDKRDRDDLLKPKF